MGKRLDPRRRSFFKAGGHEEIEGIDVHGKGGEGDGEASTAASVVVRGQACVDGFTFVTKKKGKTTAQQCQKEAGKVAEQEHIQRDDTAAEFRKRKSATNKKGPNKRRKQRKTAAASKKVQLPPYPVSEFDEAKHWNDDDPSEVVLQRFFEALVKTDLAVIQDCYGAEHSKLVGLSAEICNKFLEKLQTHMVDTIKNLRKAKKANKENARMRSRIDIWSRMNCKLEEEIGAWEDVKKTYGRKPKASPKSPSQSQSQRAASKRAFAKEDQAFLEQSCEGVLSKAIFEAYKNMSLRSDHILTILRKTSVKMREAEDYQVSVSEIANERAMQPFKADPRQLISSITSSITSTHTDVSSYLK